MIFSQTQEIIAVAADSGAESGLDKGGVEGNGEQGEAFRTRRPPTAAEGGTSPTSGEVSVGDEATGGDARRLGSGPTTRSVGEVIPKRSLGTRSVENPESEGGSTFRTRPPTADCGGTFPASAEESCTNEPEVDEDVIYSQTQKIVKLTADSGVDSGLDKVADLLGAGGREHEADVEYPEFDEEVLVGDEPTGDDGRRLGAGPTTRSVGEAVRTRSLGTRSVENPESEGGSTSRGPRALAADCGEAFRTRRPPTAACGGTSPTGGEEELLAIETVKRQARAGPMAEAIRDLMASSPEAMEVLKEFLPRGP